MVHGIGHQFRSRDATRSSWRAALATGLDDTQLPPVDDVEVEVVHYGNCFRTLDGKAAGAESDDFAALPPWGADDLEDGFELELLTAIAEGTPAAEDGKLYLPRTAQAMVRHLEASELVPGILGRAVVWLVKQAHRYLTEDALRARIQQRVAGVVDEDTRVLVGHSLGSVVAYEALVAHPEWAVDTFVTLGSPLGLRSINGRLRPPVTRGGGTPAPVRRWVNVAAREDGVASVKELEPVFGELVKDEGIRNGRRHAHDVHRYLTAEPTVAAIVDGLA